MSLSLWLEYILRFSHLVAGIAWIGSSFYFIWLDSSFEAPEIPRRNVEGELFMVHGGYYYQVEKRKIFPGELPKVLHWFKWEATLTWVTGFILFVVLYYLRGAALLIDSRAWALAQWQAIVLSLGILIGSWLLYDLIWQKIESKSVNTMLSLVFSSALIFGLTEIFSGRGAFILVGVIFGSMMLLNVWIRILPGQAKMLKDAQAGNIPDYSLSIKSKVRSVHNTYFIFPVLFIMLSNHYPTVYNHEWNWLLLILLAVSGALTRHAMVTKNSVERWILLPAAIGLAAAVYMTSAAPKASAFIGSQVTYAQVHGLMQRHCLQCHSARPTDEAFKAAPNGVLFDAEDQVRLHADKIFLHVIQAKTMPLGNRSGMTDEERALIHQWLSEQKLLPAL